MFGFLGKKDQFNHKKRNLSSCMAFALAVLKQISQKCTNVGA